MSRYNPPRDDGHVCAAARCSLEPSVMQSVIDKDSVPADEMSQSARERRQRCSAHTLVALCGEPTVSLGKCSMPYSATRTSIIHALHSHASSAAKGACVSVCGVCVCASRVAKKGKEDKLGTS